MCILIAKPKGVKAPTIDVMKKCWDNNPDGAGIAFSDGRKIILRKGFMKWDDFKEAYEKLHIDKYNAIIHFRIATHGTVKPANTHPFNVNDRIVAAHNGVLQVKNEGDWTDSETFFKRICAPILTSFKIDSKEFKLCVESLIGTSKLAFLTDNGTMHTFGNFIEDNGVYYSNTTYMHPKYVGGCYGYGDYEYGHSYYRNRVSGFNCNLPAQQKYSDEYIYNNVSVLSEDYVISCDHDLKKVYSIRHKKNRGYLFLKDEIGRLIDEKLSEINDCEEDIMSDEMVRSFILERKWEEQLDKFNEQQFYLDELDAVRSRFNCDYGIAIDLIEEYLSVYEDNEDSTQDSKQ